MTQGDRFFIFVADIFSFMNVYNDTYVVSGPTQFDDFRNFFLNLGTSI